jgi:hypothetical protein
MGVCASLVAGSFGFVNSAEARVKDSDTGLMAVICRGLQERYDDLKDVANSTSNTWEEREIARKEMSELRQMWNSQCSQFGNISYLEVQPGGIKNPGAVGGGQVFEATEGQAGPLGTKVVGERAPVEELPTLHP